MWRQPHARRSVWFVSLHLPTTLGLCPSSHQLEATPGLLRVSSFSRGDPLLPSCRLRPAAGPLAKRTNGARNLAILVVRRCPEAAFTDGQTSPGGWPPSYFTAGPGVKLRLVAILGQLSFLLVSQAHPHPRRRSRLRWEQNKQEAGRGGAGTDLVPPAVSFL